VSEWTVTGLCLLIYFLLYVVIGCWRPCYDCGEVVFFLFDGCCSRWGFVIHLHCLPSFWWLVLLVNSSLNNLAWYKYTLLSEYYSISSVELLGYFVCEWTSDTVLEVYWAPGSYYIQLFSVFYFFFDRQLLLSNWTVNILRLCFMQSDCCEMSSRVN